MGRPPSNGGPSFRFNPNEVAEMEAILQAHHTQVPAREVLVSLAEKFSASAERSGKVVVQMKQVWNWFQNRRYALRAKAGKTPTKGTAPVMPQSEPTVVRAIPQVAQPVPPPVTVRPMIQTPQGSQPIPAPSVSAGRSGSDNSQMEFEAKSARDGAWYDVAAFLSHRSIETGDPEVLVRFSGFGAEEDEWINVRRNVRQRSLPCESSECVAVLPGDLILCFQEGKEQALYFDAHVLDAQRRRHDVRGCRCRFLVRYDHDQSEEIVPLRKICRRPETDYRLELLNAESATLKQQKAGTDLQATNTLRVNAPAETAQKPPPILSNKPAEPLAKKIKTEEHANAGAMATSAYVDSSVSMSKHPMVVEHVNAGSNLTPMEQKKISNYAHMDNTVKAYPLVDMQKPPSDSVPKNPAESISVSQAESNLVPPAQVTSIAPADSMPNLTVKNIEEEEHENIAPADPAISSVATANTVEKTSEQLNSEEHANVTPAAPSVSSVTTENTVETIKEQPNPEEHTNVALADPATSSVATANTVETIKELLNSEEHANVIPAAPATSSVTVETRKEQLNPEIHSNVAPADPAISSVAAANTVEKTNVQLNTEDHGNVAPAAPAINYVFTGNTVKTANEQVNPEELANVAPAAPAVSYVAAANTVETTYEQPNPDEQAIVAAIVASVDPASCSAPTSNPVETMNKELEADEDAPVAAVAPNGDSNVSVANEYRDLSIKDAENVSTGNEGFSKTPVPSNNLMASGDSVNYTSDEVAGGSIMLDTGVGSGMVDMDGDSCMVDTGIGSVMFDQGGGSGMLDTGSGSGSVQQG